MQTTPRKNRRGATSIEYGLIAAIVSVFIIASLTTYADAANTLWTIISTTVVSAL